MAVTIRIDPGAHRALAEIARASRVSLTEALSRAVEAYRRDVFIAGLASDFRSLRADPVGWADEMKERVLWSTASSDGLTGELPHPDARKRATNGAQAKRSGKKSRR